MERETEMSLFFHTWKLKNSLLLIRKMRVSEQEDSSEWHVNGLHLFGWISSKLMRVGLLHFLVFRPNVYGVLFGHRLLLACRRRLRLLR